MVGLKQKKGIRERSPTGFFVAAEDWANEGFSVLVTVRKTSRLQHVFYFKLSSSSFGERISKPIFKKSDLFLVMIVPISLNSAAVT